MPGISFDDKEETKKNEINNNGERYFFNVEDIIGRVCYFSLSGDLALKACQEKTFKYIKKNRDERLKQHVIERLCFAVIMFDQTIMHCSDPLRSQMIYDILIECINWIDDGRIAFIFSDSIQNIEKDYINYINRKISEYSEGDFCKNEQESLQQEHINETYSNKVIELLKHSKYMIRKPTDKDFEFESLVRKDLNHKIEKIIVDSPPSDRVKVEAMHLTLYQLLKIQYMNEKKQVKYVFPENMIDELINSIEEHLESNISVARSAIVTEIIEKLNHKPNAQQRAVLDAITLRMDILYCRMNSGTRLILEFHPDYEKEGMYQIECFKSFLKLVCKSNKNISLSYDIAKKIISCDKKELEEFRNYYLASIADSSERKSLNNIDNSFITTLTDNEADKWADRLFPSIKHKIMEEIKK